MGWKLPPVYGKETGKIKKRIAKLDKKIASLQADRAIYEAKLLATSVEASN